MNLVAAIIRKINNNPFSSLARALSVRLKKRVWREGWGSGGGGRGGERKAGEGEGHTDGAISFSFPIAALPPRGCDTAVIYVKHTIRIKKLFGAQSTKTEMTLLHCLLFTLSPVSPYVCVPFKEHFGHRVGDWGGGLKRGPCLSSATITARLK